MNLFDELVRRLGAAEETISELKDVSIESLKTKNQGEQRLKNRREYLRTGGKPQKVAVVT